MAGINSGISRTIEREKQMIPTGFTEENGILDKPPQMSPDECEPLSIWSGFLTNNQPAVISCWKPTKAELEEINKTGRIWLTVWGHTMFPVHLNGFSPFQDIQSD